MRPAENHAFSASFVGFRPGFVMGQSMNSSKARLIYWAITAIFCFVAGNGCNRGQKDAWPAEAGKSARDPATVVVTVRPVEHRPVQRIVEAVGTLHGFEEVTISTKVEGRVRKILHDVADRVKPGELLLEIDPTDYDLASRQARKALDVEMAKLGLKEPPGVGFDITRVPPVVQAQARMENAKTRLDRTRSISAKQGSTPEELADKTADFRVAQAEYDNQILTARAGLAMIQMKQESLSMAQQQLDDTRIRSPIPTLGMVAGKEQMRYAITHRAVADGTFVRPGMDVFKLVIEEHLKLRVMVPEKHAGEVRVDQRADVFTAAYPIPFGGVVTRINPSVDPATRTFEVEIQVPNTEGKLKPGGFAKSANLTRLDQQATTVPLESLVTFAGVTKVFVTENGKAKEVPVTLGVQSTDWVEIAKPRLAAGSQVVTSGQTMLAEGTPISVRSSP